MVHFLVAAPYVLCLLLWYTFTIIGSKPRYWALLEHWFHSFLGTYVLVLIYLSRYTYSEVTFSVFESSCHLLLQSNHSKVEAISLSALLKDTTRELAGLYPH